MLNAEMSIRVEVGNHRLAEGQVCGVWVSSSSMKKQLNFNCIYSSFTPEEWGKEDL
jgi:hypothetical protein